MEWLTTMWPDTCSHWSRDVARHDSLRPSGYGTLRRRRCKGKKALEVGNFKTCFQSEICEKVKCVFSACSFEYRTTACTENFILRKIWNQDYHPNFSLRIIFKTSRRVSFFPNKDFLPTLAHHSCIVYKCGSCNVSYIGKNTRCLQARVDEYNIM